MQKWIYCVTCHDEFEEVSHLHPLTACHWFRLVCSKKKSYIILLQLKIFVLYFIQIEPHQCQSIIWTRRKSFIFPVDRNTLLLWQRSVILKSFFQISQKFQYLLSTWNVKLINVVSWFFRTVQCLRLAPANTDSLDTTHSEMSSVLGLLESSGGQRSPKLHVGGTLTYFYKLIMTSCAQWDIFWLIYLIVT